MAKSASNLLTSSLVTSASPSALLPVPASLVAASAKEPNRETLAALDALVQCAALAVDRVSLGELVYFWSLLVT